LHSQNKQNINKKINIISYFFVIFKFAKNNLAFLRAKVLNLKENADYKGVDLKTYNRLLIWSLKKLDKTCESGKI
jgi:hypothetical protein